MTGLHPLALAAAKMLAHDEFSPGWPGSSAKPPGPLRAEPACPPDAGRPARGRRPLRRPQGPPDRAGPPGVHRRRPAGRPGGSACPPQPARCPARVSPVNRGPPPAGPPRAAVTSSHDHDPSSSARRSAGFSRRSAPTWRTWSGSRRCRPTRPPPRPGPQRPGRGRAAGLGRPARGRHPHRRRAARPRCWAAGPPARRARPCCSTPTMTCSPPAPGRLGHRPVPARRAGRPPVRPRRRRRQGGHRGAPGRAAGPRRRACRSGSPC